MDLQAQFDAFFEKQRKEELDESQQLMLGEIILKLEAVKDKSLPVKFDFWKSPFWICSWRWIYRELAILTEETGSIQSGNTATTESGYVYAISEPFGKENPTCAELLEMLKRCVGATFTGYKGGDFRMSKNTPVNVCNTHDQSAMDHEDGTYANTWIENVAEIESAVVLVTWRENPEALTE